MSLAPLLHDTAERTPMPWGKDWQEQSRALYELSQRMGSFRAVSRATGVSVNALLDYAAMAHKHPSYEMLRRIIEPLWKGNEDLCRRLSRANGYPETLFQPLEKVAGLYDDAIRHIAEKEGIQPDEVIPLLIRRRLEENGLV